MQRKHRLQSFQDEVKGNPSFIIYIIIIFQQKIIQFKENENETRIVWFSC